MNPWKLSTFAFATAFAVVVGGSAVQRASADPPQPQPLMQKALDQLEEAHKILKAATADKGGHRVAAMKLIKEAQDEVKAGIKWDNEHPADAKPKGK